MPKLNHVFPQFELPTREMENWKYTSTRKLQDTEFDFDHVETHFASELLNQTQHLNLQQHPLAKFAIFAAKKIDVINITTSTGHPLHIRNIQQKNKAAFRYQKIHVTENVHAEIIFEHISEDDSCCFSNMFTEIILEKNATLSLYKKQTLNNQSFLIDYILVNQAKNSTFNSFTLDNGAALSRTDFFVHLNEVQAKANLNGIYLTSQKQIADHHSVIYHHVSHCESSEHYRGIASDQSKAIFNGKIIIEKNAQKSITKQLNKNLLLSNHAEINTKPELEIYADDIKASHGSTVGQLDQQALFYLQARGISTEEAKKLLLNGFLQEVFLNVQNHEILNMLSVSEETGFF